MNSPKNESTVVILVVFNMVGFLAWVIFYSFYHDYIRYFIFDILGLPFYPRVLTMFFFYFCIAAPVSMVIYFILRIFKEESGSFNSK